MQRKDLMQHRVQKVGKTLQQFSVTHIHKIPAYNWYQNLDKREKKIVQHLALATGGAGMFASGGLAIVFSNATWAMVGGTMGTGVLNLGRNLLQAWGVAGAGDHDSHDMDDPKVRQSLRKRLAWSNVVSAGTNIPQLAEGIYLLDPVRFATGGSAVLGYSLSAARYATAGFTRTKWYKGTPYTPSREVSRLPGNILIGRGVVQGVLSYKFFLDFNIASGITLLGSAVIQTFGGFVKRDSDTVYNGEEHSAHRTNLSL